MKSLWLILMAVLLTNAASAQMSYSFCIRDTQSKPLSNVEVTAKNKEKAIVLKSKTDAAGCAVFTLTEPGDYVFSYLDMTDAKTYHLPENATGRSKKTVTYDPDQIFEWQAANRTGMVFTTVAAAALKNPNNTSKVIIKVEGVNHTAVSGADVYLVDLSLKIKYHSQTSSSGTAILYVPSGNNYEVDINKTEALRRISLPTNGNVEYSETIQYEKTRVNETASGDTIYQKQIAQTGGTTTHLYYTLHLYDFNNQALPDEVVYISDLNSKRVYAGKTDEKGICSFLLEKGTNYLLNLKYEQGVTLIDASKTRGFTTAEEKQRYRGSKAIEKMLAGRHVNPQGFVVNHEQTPIRPAAKPSNYLKAISGGFQVDFATSGPVGTPTLAENKLFTQQGFYSPNFYCLDAGTGGFLWGVELGESGASPAVYQNGVLLINTYSCTLYAIDAKSGKLLWSKWLAGTIYSTPSADSNNVYVVYDNGYQNPKNEKQNYVLSCFDLRTGKMNWVNWIDNEVIACPVLQGSEVHIASYSGNYYVFDKSTGNIINTSGSIQAVSSPTITAQYIYLTASQNGKEQLLQIERKTLQPKKTYDASLSPHKINENLNCYARMNFSGARPVVYKNKVVLVLDSTSLIAFDAVSEKILWKQTLKTSSGQLPLILNDKVVVAATNGQVKTFDIYSGISQNTLQNNQEIQGQPVSFNGSLYLGSGEMLDVIKSPLKNSSGQWAKDAGHNTIW